MSDLRQACGSHQSLMHADPRLWGESDRCPVRSLSGDSPTYLGNTILRGYECLHHMQSPEEAEHHAHPVRDQDKQSHVRQRMQKMMVILLAVVKIESQTLKVSFQLDFTCHTSYAPAS